MATFIPDEFIEDGKLYFYRDGNWTDEVGMCVPITHSQVMTMAFYKTHGRMPIPEPKPKPKPRAGSKAAKAAEAKADAVRLAIHKALAEKAARSPD